MAKSKKSKSTYTSRGERPNVNRKIRNAVKAFRALNNPVEKILARLPMEKEVITKVNKGQRLTDAEKVFYERIKQKHQADNLHHRWKKVATYAACMQAVKTNWVSKFEAKCFEREKNGFVLG